MLSRNSLVVDFPRLALPTGLGATKELLRAGSKPDALSAEERVVLKKPHTSGRFSGVHCPRVETICLWSEGAHHAHACEMQL
jgi:hypothetical protein